MIFSFESNQDKYPFTLPELPYDKEAFSPYFSVETFDYHYSKHHQTYVTNLNKLLENKTEYHNKTLEEIIIATKDNNELATIFNNAAQVWNHTFFWHSIVPNGGGNPEGKILELINRDFENIENFLIKFKEIAISQFGSGWAWLVINNNKLEIIKTSNAETPITSGTQPLIACDVWEHAYYIDYRNKRPDYIEIFLKNMINWKFAENKLNI